MEEKSRFTIIAEKLDELSKEDENFILWYLLRKFNDGIEIKPGDGTIETYMQNKFLHSQVVNANEIIDYLAELMWG